jgi:Uma2 family endonuclease
VVQPSEYDERRPRFLILPQHVAVLRRRALLDLLQQSTRPRPIPAGQEQIPLLEPGDHLDQPTFHARYTAMPEDIKAELVGGVVYMPALRRTHGRSSGLLIRWLGAYEDGTPGVEVYDNATTIMGEESEPQPDACLIIRPEYGGQMQFTADDYLQGAPELAGEIAYSTESYDLYSKKRDYELAGVREYLVVALGQQSVLWFVNRGGKFEEKRPDADGIIRSEVFSGLWLDPDALIGLDGRRLLAILQQGLATPAHAAFVSQLAARRKT